jgi:hypothetical protein
MSQTARAMEAPGSAKALLSSTWFVASYQKRYNNQHETWLKTPAGGGGEMADAADLKSAGVIPVWVRLPPALFEIGKRPLQMRRAFSLAETGLFASDE